MLNGDRIVRTKTGASACIVDQIVNLNFLAGRDNSSSVGVLGCWDRSYGSCAGRGMQPASLPPATIPAPHLRSEATGSIYQ